MPCSPTSWSASFTSSSLNGLMIASIFFTERLPGISKFQIAGLLRVHGDAQVDLCPDAQPGVPTIALEHDHSGPVSQKQGLCHIQRGVIPARYQLFKGDAEVQKPTRNGNSLENRH